LSEQAADFLAEIIKRLEVFDLHARIGVSDYRRDGDLARGWCDRLIHFPLHLFELHDDFPDIN